MNMSEVGGQPSKYMKTWLAYSVSMEASPIILCKGFLHHLICLHRVCCCWMGHISERLFDSPFKYFQCGKIWLLVSSYSNNNRWCEMLCELMVVGVCCWFLVDKYSQRPLEVLWLKWRGGLVGWWELLKTCKRCSISTSFYHPQHTVVLGQVGHKLLV